MPTPQQYAGQTGVIRPMNGAVPGLTWDSFLSAINNGTNLAANYAQPANSYAGGEGGGFAGITPHAYDIAGLGTVGVIDNGGSPAYVQDVGDGTTNWFNQNPDRTVGSQNRTQNSDSWWDSTGLPLVASLAFGGATSGLAAAGIGVDGVTGAAIGSASAGLPGATSTGLNTGGAAGGVANGLGGTNDIASASYNPYNPANWTADAGGVASDASNVATQEAANPSWLQQAQSYYAGLDPLTKFGVGTLGSTITSGLSGSGSGDNSFSSLINGYGGESSGLDFSSSGSLDSSGSSGWLNSLLNGVKTGYGAVKDFTGLNGQQLLGTGASIANGILGSNAAQTAAGQQTNAINNANALTAAIYGDSVNRNKPYLDAGASALGQQTSLLGLNGAAAQTAAQGQFQASPDYQWRFDQGQKAVANGAAASGLIGSGRYLKDLTNYGQGAASQEYGNYSNKLANLINVGQNSANLQGQLGAGYGNTAAALTTAGGIAQSAGTMGGANAYSNALTQLLKLQSGNGYYSSAT